MILVAGEDTAGLRPRAAAPPAWLSRMTSADADLARTARLDVLFTGYAALPRVAGTVSLVRDAGRVIVVDPGMVPSRSALLDPMGALGVAPEDVTEVVLSHHHPDHLLHASQERVLALADLIVPGHGPAFSPGPDTPR